MTMSTLFRRTSNDAAPRVAASSEEQLRQAMICLTLAVFGIALGVTGALALHGL